MPSRSSLKVDVTIIGSGFGGCLSALILKQSGLSVAVIDKGHHPRFTIGESSTPIANMVLRDLAKRYQLPWLTDLTSFGSWQSTYPNVLVGKKRGFSYYHHEFERAFTPSPSHTNALLVAASSSDTVSDTQWYRSDVDALFAQHVQAAKIPFFEDTRITTLSKNEDWSFDVETEHGTVVVQSKFVIDASGRGGVLPQALGLKDCSASLQTNTRALYSHFENVPRWQTILEEGHASLEDYPFQADDAALHHIIEGGWMWMIRFEDEKLSAGFVLDTRIHPMRTTVSAEAEWHALLSHYPTLKALFKSATLAPSPGQFIRTDRLQRRWETCVGKDWALLPFTAGFVDPLHSTGIAHTICGIERLCHTLKTHWGQPTLPSGLSTYATAIEEELTFLDQLINICYRSLHDFNMLTAATMLYFASTIRYEQARSIAHNRVEGPAFQRWFLCADEPGLRSILTEAHTWLDTHHELKPSDAQAFSNWVEEAIAPYNSVGLFRPKRPNMYHHTAAPL